MTQEMDPATVLEEAADLLLIRGRCIGSGQDEEGRYCVLGAIADVLGLEDWAQLPFDAESVVVLADEVRRDAEDLYRARWGESQNCDDPKTAVYIWNDFQEAEASDFVIIDTLRHVAKDLRNEAWS